MMGTHGEDLFAAAAITLDEHGKISAANLSS